MSRGRRLLAGFALALSLPVGARAQGLPAPLLVPASPDVSGGVLMPGASPLAGHDARSLELHASRDSSRSGAHAERHGQDDGPSMAKHVLIGAVGGLLVGGVIGIQGDRRCRDCMMPATPFTSTIGAALGALLGLTVYNLRVHP